MSTSDESRTPTVEYLSSRLQRQTTASSVDYEQNDSSQVIYRLYFDEKVGFDWLKSQVKEVQHDSGEELQMWKIEPGFEGATVVTVKELEPRYTFDDSQMDFEHF